MGQDFAGSNPVSHPHIFSSLLRESARFGQKVAVQREDALLGTYAQKTPADFSTGNNCLPVGLEEPDN